jgi:hypothetical protein
MPPHELGACWRLADFSPVHRETIHELTNEEQQSEEGEEVHNSTQARAMIGIFTSGARHRRPRRCHAGTKIAGTGQI